MKSTDDLLKELSGTDDINDFLKNNENNLDYVSISKYLNRLVSEKNLKKSEVIRNSELSEIYAYQIFSGKKCNPSRDKVLCLAFGMGLNVEETQQMLKVFSFPILYAKRKRDSIIIFALNKGLSVLDTNELLYNSDEETLG
ncbi:MAG: hypothetical protein K2L10_04440 [Ruminococcus sp.]|nr:hypothetical protein [Ruminococcus sp.]